MGETKQKTRVIGIDVRVDTTDFAIVDISGRVLAKNSVNNDDYDNINSYIQALSNAIVETSEKCVGFENIRSVGISCPSGNRMTGSIHNSPVLRWKGVVPFATMLRDQLGIAVALSNDVEATALGEMAFGSAHEFRTFLTINVGNGLGGCFTYNGKIISGATGFAGEIGHICLIPNGRKCGCGLQGCAEIYTASPGIILTAKELMTRDSRPSLMREYGDKLTPKDIFDCCEKGDQMAIEVFKITGEYLGIALATYASVTDPEAIILTGGVMGAGKWILEPTEDSFNRHVFGNIKDKVKLIKSTLNNSERNILGASALAWTVKEYSLFK